MVVQKTKIMASGSVTSWQIDEGEKWREWQILFSWAPVSPWMVTAAMKLKDTCKKSYDQPRQHIKKQRHYIADKGPSSQTIVFSVIM